MAGRVELWQLLAYVEHLPGESALHREMGGVDAVWSAEAHLLAGVLDELRAGHWAQRVHFRGKKTASDPVPDALPRPSDVEQRSAQQRYKHLFTAEGRRKLRRLQHAHSGKLERRTDALPP